MQPLTKARSGGFSHVIGLWAALFWLACGLKTASAGLSAPSSNATLSADGKRLLVMVSPAVEYEKKHWPVLFKLPDGRSVILRETFPKSGAYDAATLAPIRQANVYGLKGYFCSSADFADVAFLNIRALEGKPADGSDVALMFFHEGRPTRRYTAKDLLTGLRHKAFFQFTSWDYYYQWWDTFTTKGNHLVLATARRRLVVGEHSVDYGLQESYVFDLATGAMISRSISGWWYPVCYGATGALICSLLLLGRWFWRWRQRRRKAP